MWKPQGIRRMSPGASVTVSVTAAARSKPAECSVILRGRGRSPQLAARFILTITGCDMSGIITLAAVRNETTLPDGTDTSGGGDDGGWNASDFHPLRVARDDGRARRCRRSAGEDGSSVVPRRALLLDLRATL